MRRALMARQYVRKRPANMPATAPDTAALINIYVPSDARLVAVASSTPSQNLAAKAMTISASGSMEPGSITVFATGSTMKRVRLAMNTPAATPASAATTQTIASAQPVSGSVTRCAMPQTANTSGTMASLGSGAVPLFMALNPRESRNASSTQTQMGVP